MKCYEEVIDFIASGPSAGAVAAFRLSDAVNKRAESLVQREKGGELTASEQSELDHYLELEHIMRLAKARARSRSPRGCQTQFFKWGDNTCVQPKAELAFRAPRRFAFRAHG